MGAIWWKMTLLTHNWNIWANYIRPAAELGHYNLIGKAKGILACQNPATRRPLKDFLWKKITVVYSQPDNFYMLQLHSTIPPLNWFAKKKKRKKKEFGLSRYANNIGMKLHWILQLDHLCTLEVLIINILHKLWRWVFNNCTCIIKVNRKTGRPFWWSAF